MQKPVYNDERVARLSETNTTHYCSNCRVLVYRATNNSLPASNLCNYCIFTLPKPTLSVRKPPPPPPQKPINYRPYLKSTILSTSPSSPPKPLTQRCPQNFCYHRSYSKPKLPPPPPQSISNPIRPRQTSNVKRSKNCNTLLELQTIGDQETQN